MVAHKECQKQGKSSEAFLVGTNYGGARLGPTQMCMHLAALGGVSI